MREAGSTAVQEIAFTFANAIAYVEAVRDRGVEVDSFAPRLSWIFNTHMNFFEEIAKYRTLRRLWARIMKDRFGATDPRSMMLRFHTQTGGATLTAQQPENNIVRTALQALAAVLGGAQSLHTNSLDEALALPSEKAVTIALRTQQIIAEEIGVTDTIDPIAGSYYVESLTNELERLATEEMRRIEEMGGAVEAIESGYYHRAILDEAYRWEQAVNDGERVVVGVNKYRDDDEPEPEYFKVDQTMAAEQRAKLDKLRAERDTATVEQALAGLRRAAEGRDNLMPSIIESVHAYCTLGEICGAMREVFGEYKALAAI
jgi:methylmalonyl-CoA mutase N-terminal domain/subunit